MLLALLWVTLGIILILLELNIPGAFLFLIAGASCIITSFSTLYDLEIKYQIGLFFFNFFIFFLITKKVFNTKDNPELKNNNDETNFNLLINKTGITVKPIHFSSPGLIKINGEFWRARNFNVNEKILVDQKVKVIKIEGNSLYVVRK